jgi:hypothetical protein
MDKESNSNERDVDMAIAKEPKNGIQQITTSEHKKKISKVLKQITSQHSKLLKKLAE